jgi:hypothetical protein
MLSYFNSKYIIFIFSNLRELNTILQTNNSQPYIPRTNCGVLELKFNSIVRKKKSKIDCKVKKEREKVKEMRLKPKMGDYTNNYT